MFTLVSPLGIITFKLVVAVVYLRPSALRKDLSALKFASAVLFVVLILKATLLTDIWAEWQH